MMHRTRTKGAFGLLMATLITGVSMPAQDRFITEGHFDLAVDYVPGEGWNRYLYDYGTGNQLDPTTSVYRIGAEALAEVPDDPAYSLLGNPGDSIWVIPEIYNPEIIYLGIGAPLLGRNIFTGGLSNRGQVTMRLVSVSGSGPDSGGTLTMWQSGFPPRFHFSTADGIGPEDSLGAITANFHAHYNWAFTEPGLYRVTFAYSGTLLPEHGGGFTSTEVTYSFDIGGQPTYLHEGHADIALHYEAGHGLEFLVVADDDHEHDHAEHEDHGEEGGHEHEHGSEMHPGDVIFLLGGYAVNAVPGDAALAFLGDPGSLFYLSGQQEAEGVPFIGWNTEELDPAAFPGDIALELHEVKGPGNVFLYEVDAFGGITVIWDSSDAAEDVFTLPAGIHRHLNLAVTAPGTYELTVHAEAELAAGGAVHTETVLTVQAGGMEGYFGHFERLSPAWIHAETGDMLHTGQWPWLWSPDEGWLFAWGHGGPNHFYFRAGDDAWLWTAPAAFPYHYTFGSAEWATWGSTE